MQTILTKFNTFLPTFASMHHLKIDRDKTYDKIWHLLIIQLKQNE